MKKLVALAGLLALGSVIGVAFAGRGSDQPSSAAALPARISSNPYPYTNPIKRKGSSPAELAGDGRYFGSVRAADAESQPQSIDFDVAQFFFGEDVQKAAEADGAVRPGEAVANDHYARDPKNDIDVLPLAPDVQVTAGPPASFLMSYMPYATQKRCYGSTGYALSETNACLRLSLPAFFGALKELDYRRGIPVWVTIDDGRVVRIDEQYFP